VEELRFDERVAIVTGAGRGLGRAHATLLAARGAQVVVNDLGGTRVGEDGNPDVADGVAEELRAAGYTAMSDASDVASASGAAALVERTIEAYGRVDIVVNNAGILAPDDFPDVDLAEFRHHFDVHVGGALNVTRACWPHMANSGYGRVVMTTSHCMLGFAHMTSYCTAKGAVFSLARTLALVGASLGIKVNGVAPIAATRLAGLTGAQPAGSSDERSPSLASPLVALLCHESCPANGETFLSGGRRYARLFVAETFGYLHPDLDVTPEAVARNWTAVMHESDYAVLTDTPSWLQRHDAIVAASPGVST
jgi:NAD(P)-dependent dehydrogenase (short-subunit alcohol dehydrogenase family)